MNLLLDTHVLIWTLENNPTLSDMATSAIVDGNNLVFVSSASVWEIGIKKNIGKLETPDNLLEEMESHRFTPLAINHKHAQLAAKLPAIHKDHFDRLLIAQAIIEKLILVTRDKVLAGYSASLMEA